MAEIDGKKCIDTNKLAKRWDVDPRTLQRWRSVGKGPVFLRIEGRIRYSLADIEAFEEAAHRGVEVRDPRVGEGDR